MGRPRYSSSRLTPGEWLSSGRLGVLQCHDGKSGGGLAVNTVGGGSIKSCPSFTRWNRVGGLLGGKNWGAPG